MKLSELEEQLDQQADVVPEVDDDDVEEEEECSFDDDDFNEALELLQHARYQLEILRKQVKGAGRGKSIEQLTDEIKQFLDLFVPAPAEVGLTVYVWTCRFCGTDNNAELMNCAECQMEGHAAEMREVIRYPRRVEEI